MGAPVQGFTGLLGSQLDASPQKKRFHEVALQRRGISVRPAAEATQHSNGGMGGSVSVPADI